MNKKNIAGIVAIVFIAVLGTVYFLGFKLNPAEKTVHDALLYLNDINEEKDPSEIFNSEFISSLLANYSFYKVDEWELTSEKKSNDKYIVFVDGKATNAFGSELNRSPSFVVEDSDYSWEITDSYDFFHIEKLSNLNSDYSDLEVHDLWIETKNKVNIEDWSFSVNSFDSAEGEAVITNNSELPIDYVKLEVEYFNDSDQLVNSDWTYAIGGNYLYPGQKRRFSWITSSCYNCEQARIDLNFD